MVLMLNEMTSDEARYRGIYNNFKYPKDLRTVLSVIAQDDRVFELPMNKIYAILSNCEKWLNHFKEGKYKKYYYPTLKAIAENGAYHPHTYDIKNKLQNVICDYFGVEEDDEEEINDHRSMEFCNNELLQKYITD